MSVEDLPKQERVDVNNAPATPITELIENFNKGLYRHYKGNQYLVIDLVKHSETEEWLVLYRPCYGEQLLWVRPITMFFETVIDVQGSEVARFEFVAAQSEISSGE